MNYNIQTLEKLIKNIQWFDLPARLKAIFNKLPTGSSEPSYKVYTALLTQEGTNAPVATVLQNTLGVTPVLTRDGIGFYKITATGVFEVGKTFVYANHIALAHIDEKVGITSSNVDFVRVTTTTTAGVLSDNIIFNREIEIRVYN